MKPLITVIIPTHNNEKTIAVAIDSILSQTWENLEILIIDDNSTDTTKDVVSTYITKDTRISYHPLPWNDPQRINKRGRNINAGFSARNHGFEKSHGDFITFQDADDASFTNRIEIQYQLLTQYKATHVTLDWQKLDTRYICKKFNVEQYLTSHELVVPEMVEPEKLISLARVSKGIALKILGRLHTYIPFEIKRLRLVNKLFFGTLLGYPGTGNSPLFKREVINSIRFRKLSARVWPSFMGRGADRDFNFQVAETFKNSYVFFLPLYMWRQNIQNSKYTEDLGKYIIDTYEK